jgi:TctA family transporter
VGVFLVSFNTFDLWLMIALAVVCLALRLLDYPMAPLLLGFVLGKLLEENLRRALLVHDGSFAFLWERPVTAALIALSVAGTRIRWAVACEEVGARIGGRICEARRLNDACRRRTHVVVCTCNRLDRQRCSAR